MKKNLAFAFLSLNLLGFALTGGPAFIPSALADSISPAPQASGKLDMSFLLLPAYELEPAPASTSASPTPESEIHKVGDEIVLHVPQLTVPQGTTTPLKVDLPPGSSSLNDEGFEIFTKPDASALKLIVVPMKAGKLTLPSLAIQDASGKSFARTNPYRMDVESAIKPNDPKPQEPAELRPPAELAFPWWAVALMAAGALLVVGAIVYSLYRWNKSRKAALLAKPVEPPKPEDEVALSALAQLEKSGTLERGEYKKHYFRVSEILKTYIGARYGFDAPENTTREMMQNLREAWTRELAGDEKRLTSLAELFDQLDRVKFTDYVPASIESQGVIGVAREFVRATRRKPMVVTPNEGPSAVR